MIVESLAALNGASYFSPIQLQKVSDQQVINKWQLFVQTLPRYKYGYFTTPRYEPALLPLTLVGNVTYIEEGETTTPPLKKAPENRLHSVKKKHFPRE